LKAFGRHLIVEYRGCDTDILNRMDTIERLMREAASEAGTTVVASVFHPFSPQGITGVVVIEESHLSIHTWPEHGYAAVDFYTCGDGDPETAHRILMSGLDADYAEVMQVDRGIESPGKSIEVQFHRTEVPEEIHSHGPVREPKTGGDDARSPHRQPCR